MSLGQNIRALRRERGITQEALAEQMNLSVSAVSQWECGRTSPDVAQIPLLCHLFEVTADALLGIDIDRKTERIQAIYDAAKKQSWDGYHGEAIAALRRGLAEYPGSYRLMEGLASELFCYADQTTNDEVVSLCDKILEGCTDGKIRQAILVIVCRMYPKVGRREEALRMAQASPGYQDARQELLTWLYDGEMLMRQYKENMLATTSLLINNLIDYAQRSRSDEAMAFYEMGAQIMQVLFRDEPQLFHSQYSEICHKGMAARYIEQQDVENALAQLEMAARFALAFDDACDPDETHTALLFGGLGGGGFVRDEPGWGRCQDFLEQLEEVKYDFVRDDARFAAVKALLARKG